MRRHKFTKQHCRCRKCKRRQVVAGLKDTSVCRYCGGPIRVDKWATERRWRSRTCTCDGYIFPHHRGSALCFFHNSGRYKTHEELYGYPDPAGPAPGEYPVEDSEQSAPLLPGNTLLDVDW